MPPQLLAVGRVLRPHGVRGDLLLEVLTDFPEHLAEVDTVYVGEAATAHRVADVRFHRGQLLLRLAGCADRDAADRFRGQLVQIGATTAKPLPPGQYYWHQIIGLAVFTEEGEALGHITEILETGANDVYVVKGPEGQELLLPALKSVLKAVDLEAKRMTVRLLEGLR